MQAYDHLRRRLIYVFVLKVTTQFGCPPAAPV